MILEGDGAVLAGELDGGDQLPRAQARRMRRATAVVGGEALSNVGGQADVVAVRALNAAENVDEVLLRLHGDTGVQDGARGVLEECERDRSTGWRLLPPCGGGKYGVWDDWLGVRLRPSGFGGTAFARRDSRCRAAGLPSRSSPQASEGWRPQPEPRKGGTPDFVDLRPDFAIWLLRLARSPGFLPTANILARRLAKAVQ